MADQDRGGADGGAAPAPPKAKPPLGVLLILVNSVLVLAALGALVYTKLLYHRPEIVESEELQKKKDEATAPAVAVEKASFTFDQMLVNIAMTSGKAHYATVAFSVECLSKPVADAVAAKKALFIDKVVAALGRRQITELNTIQGKLLLKTELLREFNTMVTPAGSITNVFFSTFILQ